MKILWRALLVLGLCFVVVATGFVYYLVKPNIEARQRISNLSETDKT